MFLQGMETVIRHRESNLDSVFKRFDAHQKAKICGCCYEKTWDQVQLIWKEIKESKDEKKLCGLMIAKWGKLKTNLNSNFATVYWEDDLLQAIWAVNFTQGLLPCFLTSRVKAAPLTFLEQKVAKIEFFEANKSARGKTIV